MIDADLVGKLWDSFPEMIKDIRQNCLTKVVQYDDPVNLEFGYKSDTQYWRIKASNIEAGMSAIVSTEAGKQKALNYLNDGK